MSDETKEMTIKEQQEQEAASFFWGFSRGGADDELLYLTVYTSYRTPASDEDDDEGHDEVLWETYNWERKESEGTTRPNEISHGCQWITFLSDTTEYLDHGGWDLMDWETQLMKRYPGWDGKGSLNIFRDELPPGVSKWVTELLSFEAEDIPLMLEKESISVNEIKDAVVRSFFQEHIQQTQR